MGSELSGVFTDAMRAFVGNCSVITVGKEGDCSGLLLTSAISLSVSPPLLLACVNKSSSSWPLLEKYQFFGCSFLGANHQKIAENFSGFGGIKGSERYEDGEWEMAETGALLLKDAPSAFDCRVEKKIDFDTHSVVIGQVCAVLQTENTKALIYRRGKFQSL